MSAPTTAPAARKVPRLGDPVVEREMQVLLRMAQGLTNREIGSELYLTEDTVKTYARRLFAKLGARDRAHAVAIGYQKELLRGDATDERGPISGTHLTWCAIWRPQSCNCRTERR